MGSVGNPEAPEILARSLERARRREAEGLWEEAAQIYAWLIERFPEAPERSEWEEGVHRCRQMLQLEADWAAAEEADQAGDREAARAALRRIVDRHPEFERGGRTARAWLEDLERERAARQRRYRAFAAVFGFVLAALGCGAGIALVVFVWHSAAGLFPIQPSPSPTSLILETPSPSLSPVPPDENEPSVFPLPAMPLSAAPERIAVLARWGTEGVPAGAALSPDGRWIAFPIGNRVEWFEADTLRSVRTLEIPAVDVISRLAFSPDGRWFAVGTEGGRIYLGSVAEQAIVSPLVPKHRGVLVESLAFSPDSLRLAAGQTGEIDLWEIPGVPAKWELSAQFAIPVEATLRVRLSPVSALSLERRPMRIFDLLFASDGGGLIAGSGAGAIHFLDLQGQEIRRLEPGGAWVTALARSPDGALLAAGDSSGRISLWRLPDGAAVVAFPAHAGGVTALAFFPDGAALLSGGTDRTIRIWPLRDRAGKVWYEDRIAWVDSVGITVDGRVMASFSDGHLRIWRWPDGQPEREIQRPSGMYPHALAFDPAGRWLAAGFADGTLRIWPISSTRPLATWGAHTLWVDRIVFHPEGRWLASAGVDGKIYGWSLPGGERIAAFEVDPGWPSDLAITPDGEFLIAGGFNLRIYRFAVRTGERAVMETGFLQVTDEAGRPLRDLLRTRDFHLRSTLALSPDGRRLALHLPGLPGEIALDSSFAFGRSLQRMLLPEGPGLSGVMAFSPDGRWLFAGTWGGAWRLPLPEGSPAERLISEPVLSMALSPRGDLLALGGFSGRIDLIRLPDGQRIRTLYGHRGEAVIALAISPDGRVLASGGEDGTIVLWGVR